MVSESEVVEAKRVLSERWLRLPLAARVIAYGTRWSVQASALSRVMTRAVHAVGVGRKITQGKRGKELSVRVYVARKLPRAVLPANDALPKDIDGIPVDVVEAPPAHLQAALPNRRRHRPCVAGISAGHRDVTAGTIGYFVLSKRTREHGLFILSNNHVLANVNRGKRGDPVLQPGRYDGGRPRDRVAVLQRSVPIRISQRSSGMIPNRVDAAIARLELKPAQIKVRLLQLGVVDGVSLVEDGLRVAKEGRTTGVTRGLVDDIDVDAVVGMDGLNPERVALFEGQIRILPSRPFAAFSSGGDSGSLIITARSTRAVGLLFAGPNDDSYTLANLIQPVLELLEVDLARQ